MLLTASLLSGISGLGYEMLWVRLLTVSLGAENVAISGVLAGYFGGLSLGSYLFSRNIVRSRNPIRLYIIFQIVASGYALISPVLLMGLADVLPGAIGGLFNDANTAGGFGLSLIVSGMVLLPPAVCLGASLPALIEARRRKPGSESGGSSVGYLYGANTLGGVIGIMLSTYWAFPNLGLAKGAALLAAAGLGACCAVFGWKGGNTGGSEVAKDKTDKTAQGAALPIMLLLFGYGLAGMAFEVTGIQVLSLVFRNTVYTLANILCVFLVGTSAGAWFYAVWFRDRLPAPRLTAILSFALALAVGVSGFALSHAQRIALQADPLGKWEYWKNSLLELGISALVFLLPTLLMGALFSHLVGRVSTKGSGTPIAVNMLGGTIAPVLLSLVIIDRIGYTATFFLVVVLYALLFIGAALLHSARWAVAGCCAVALLGIVLPRNLVNVETRGKERIIARHESAMGHVVVMQRPSRIDTGRQLRFLKVDRFFTMGGGTGYEERRLSHLPLLLSQARGRALFLGVGTGASLGAVRTYDFKRVDAVELVPGILDVMPHFAHINDTVYRAGNVNFYCSDARRFVASRSDRYEFIFADLFHPERNGAGSLFTREHFSAVRSRLATGGVFAQLIPLFQFETPLLKTVIKTFTEQFPVCHSFIGLYAGRSMLVLLGSEKPLTASFESIRAQIEQAPRIRELVPYAEDVFGSYMLDRDALAAFSGHSSINTDLNQRVLYDAPRSTHRLSRAMRARSLAALLAHRMRCPRDFISGIPRDSLPDVLGRIDRYWQATNAYLNAELLAQNVPAGKALSWEAVDGYLRSYELHPDFARRRGLPYTLAPGFPMFHRQIYARTSAVTPAQRWLHIDYLKFVRERGDTAAFNSAFALASKQAFDGPNDLIGILRDSNYDAAREFKALKFLEASARQP